VSHPALFLPKVKANLSSDLSKRLSDAVILDQLSTLLFAGSDTTALSLSWCIHLLSLSPDIQTRLREEILSLPLNSSSYSDSSRASSPTPSETQSYASCSSFSSEGVYSEYAHADAIDALPYLDGVVRETLRLCPPVHSTIRTPTQNDTIPISSPVVLRDGTKITPSEGIFIRKGSYVHIPVEGLNMSEEIWGKDAREFKYVLILDVA
jgi:cytochrome P450